MALKMLVHEGFMKSKNISETSLPEELKKVHNELIELKKEDFDSANVASQDLLESLQELYFEQELEEQEKQLEEVEKEIDAIQDLAQNPTPIAPATVETDGTQREALKEEIEEKQEEIQEIKENIEEIKEEIAESGVESEKIDNQEEKTDEQLEKVEEKIEEVKEEGDLYSSNEERILAELLKEGKEFITRPELKSLGFSCGFFSKLTIRGATYGAYKLEKNFSDEVFKIIKLV